MNTVIITCKATGERRIYEKSLLLSENWSDIQKMVDSLDEEWNLKTPVEIIIESDEHFHELTYFIETLKVPSSVVRSWIIITTNKKTHEICKFKKNLALSRKWDIIIAHVKQYGGKVSGNTFDFQNSQKASAFCEKFVREFLI